MGKTSSLRPGAGDLVRPTDRLTGGATIFTRHQSGTVTAGDGGVWGPRWRSSWIMVVSSVASSLGLQGTKPKDSLRWEEAGRDLRQATYGKQGGRGSGFVPFRPDCLDALFSPLCVK